MNKTKWLAIFVLSLLLGTYYFEFYSPRIDEEKKAEQSKIIQDPAEQINEIQIENSKGRVLLKRDPTGWTLIEPLKDWADNQYVEDFVNGLTSEKALDASIETQPIDWPMYGLDSDFSKVTFRNQKGGATEIIISKKKNFEGNSFLRRNQEDRVLISSSQWTMRSQGAALDYRDKRLFRGKIGSIDEILVKSPKGEFFLVRKDNHWGSPKAPDIKLDQNKVRELLTSLNEIKANEFVSSLPAGQPKLTLSLKSGEKIWSADIIESQPDRSVYAKTSDPKFLLKLEKGKVEDFYTMTLMSLRDRREPFDFKNLLVHEIEIETPLKKWALVKKGTNWQIRDNASSEVEDKQVRNFISRLSDSGVTEYLDKVDVKNASGAVGNRLILKGEKDELLFRLDWGGSIKKKTLAGEKNLILAKSNLFADIFGLDQSVVDSWGLNNLLPVDADKQKTNQKKETQ